MSDVKKLVEEIKSSVEQKYASAKDETKIMVEMLNDLNYKVGEYSKKGKIGEVCPAENARNIISRCLSSTAGMSKEEAKDVSTKYQFTKEDADNFIGISKEFVNTYLSTGRKLPLGGREKMNVQLLMIEKPDSTVQYPKKIGIDKDGNDMWESAQRTVKAHNTIKVFSKPFSL